MGRKRWLISPPEMASYLGDGKANWRHRERDITAWQPWPAHARSPRVRGGDPACSQQMMR
ncbi:MAG: hypothetical protein MJE77_27125 [Proteobacteria bacterium]|nr:hypothetical protein [Pseudomonadota bacterium]